MLQLLLMSNVPAVSAALINEGPNCGTKTCMTYQFCSKFHTQCEDCSTICDPVKHNYEKEICQQDCQNYLHDSQYVKLSNYSADIKQLKNQQIIIMIITIVLLILFILIHGLRFVKWCRSRNFSMNCFKNMITKKKEKPTMEPTTHVNPNTESPKATPKNLYNNNYNRTNSVFSVSGTEVGQNTVSTPISTRHPAEDSTLDYSYVNRGLNITPVNEKPRTETTF